jgi:hypothetical protein
MLPDLCVAPQRVLGGQPDVGSERLTGLLGDERRRRPLR